MPEHCQQKVLTLECGGGDGQKVHLVIAVGECHCEGAGGLCLALLGDVYLPVLECHVMLLAVAVGQQFNAVGIVVAVILAGELAACECASHD